MSDIIVPNIEPMNLTEWNSPIAQSNAWSPLTPYEWQKAVWMASWKQGARVAVRTANGSGKSSFVVPILALSFVSAFPGAQVVITSNSDAQIKQQLWPAIEQMALPLKASGWKINKELIQAPSVDGMRGSEIIMRVTKQGENFEGYHERAGLEDDQGRLRYGPLMIIADEAKSISHGIFEAIGRCTPDVLLYISTTGQDVGDFYDACMNVDGTWTTGIEYNGKHQEFVIDWEQCPHLYDGWRGEINAAKLKAAGKDDAFIKSYLLAEFARGSEYQVFSESDMRMARAAMQKNRPLVGINQRAFCDFSGGGDELTFGFRKGNDFDDILAWTRDTEIAPSIEAAKYIREFMRKGLTSEQISGDNGGLGAGIISEMGKKGWLIQRINANVPAKEKDQYVDRYTEMHWEFKKQLQGGMLRLPFDEKLLDQMRRRRYVMRNTDDNKIRMEPKPEAKKKRQEASPDRLDTIVHLCRDMEQLPTAREIASKNTRCGVPKEYWDQLKKQEEEGGEDGNPYMGGWSGI